MDGRKTEKLAPVIELGGRSWTLRMTHNVMMMFASTTRTPLNLLEEQIGRYDYMVLLFWFMLREEDPQLKRETFNGWMDAIGVKGVLTEVMPAVAQAIAASMPDAEPEAAEGDPTAAEAQA